MKVTKTFQQIVMTSILLSLSSGMFADDLDKDEERDQIPLMLGEKPPPYTNPTRYIIDAAFIYWQADSDGFDIGTKQVVLGNSTGDPEFLITISDQMKEKGMNFQLDPGFRFGLGVVCGDRDEWDLFFNWTWLQSFGKAHDTNSPELTTSTMNLTDAIDGGVVLQQDSLAPEWVTSNPSAMTYWPFTAYETKASWRLQYDVLDFEIGRNFSMGSLLTMRPHIGVRAACINQRSKVDYDLNVFSQFQSAIPIVDAYTASEFVGKNRYIGAGLRSGIDLNWNFGDHFCVYSKVSGSILYGPYDVNETVTTTGTLIVIDDSLPSTLTTSFSGKFDRTRTNLQIATGFTWRTAFNKDQAHFFISAGYEVNEWFQQNELRNFSGNTFQPFLTATRKNGGLGLHGLTIDVKFDF